VNQLPFFEGRQKTSSRESFLYFAPNGQVRAVKWRDWKLHYVWQDEPGQPVERTMKLFNLRSDPKEETDIKDANPWVPSAIGKLVDDFWATVDKYPLIPVGAPDPDQPPPGSPARVRPTIGETVTTASGLRVLTFGLMLLPDAHALHQALAASQAQRGAVADAIRSYESAVRLNPQATEADRRNHEAATKALAELRGK
jgi:hypothetical protein